MSDYPSRPPVLIVPGKGNSEATHWQTWLENRLHRLQPVQRVEQTSWDAPVLADWVNQIAEAIATAPAPPLIVAHSFGCLATVSALLRKAPDVAKVVEVAGAILVAPADPARFALAEPPLLRALPCRALVVASSNDPWMSLPRAERFARAWRAPVHSLGAVGHINVASGFGPWPQMLHWVRNWVQYAEPQTAAHFGISIADRNRSATPGIKLA